MNAITDIRQASMTVVASRIEADAPAASRSGWIRRTADDDSAAAVRISNIGGGETGIVKQVSMIVAAAACAGFIAMLLPGFAPQVAARTSQPIQEITGVSTAAARAEFAGPASLEIGETGEPNLPNAEHELCAQNWPYYAPSCLHDSRQIDGRAPTVRMIALDRLGR